MSFRVTEAAKNANITNQINLQRQRIGQLQEQLSSGKRINRPSDDPVGANVVLQLRTSQSELKQFSNNAATAKDVLIASDNVLDSYQLSLDRATALLTRGISDNTLYEERQAIAIEIDGVIDRVHNLANTKWDDRYLFGGSRVNAAPFDTNGVPATTTASPIQLQIEPNAAPIQVGVLSESTFSDATSNILTELKAAATALRGTGNAAADTTTLRGVADRLEVFADLSNIARTQIGERINQTTNVSDTLQQTSLSLEETIGRYETADFTETAVQFTAANTALEAILQTAAQNSRRSLLDFLG